MMEYKGYLGKVVFDPQAGLFHGEVINTRDIITFQGESVSELNTAFRESVNDYLAFCHQRGEAPEKPFSGQFVTRIPPELHRLVHKAAMISGKSLNAWVTEQLKKGLKRQAKLDSLTQLKKNNRPFPKPKISSHRRTKIQQSSATKRDSAK